MNLNLSPAQTADLLAEARREIVAAMLGDKNQLLLVSPTQAAALLDITTKTLAALPIPKVTLSPTSSVRYLMTDIKDYINLNRK